MIMICLLSLQFLFASSRKPKDYTPDQLEKAPDTLTIRNLELTLDTYLWRDFMPQSPPDGKPLRASITVISANQEFLPADIDADKLWIINGQEVWSTSLQSVRENLPSEKITRIEKMARGGPKWEPGTWVTVVIQIMDQQGNSHLLKVKDQLIHRTD
jgi:hypothetical protein